MDGMAARNRGATAAPDSGSVISNNGATHEETQASDRSRRRRLARVGVRVAAAGAVVRALALQRHARAVAAFACESNADTFEMPILEGN